MFLNRLFIPFLFSLILCTGCNSEEIDKSEEEAGGNKIELVDGWVRPGGPGMMSAAYLTVRNRTNAQDTLIGVSSEAAQKTEIHESYKGENGMSAMRPSPNTVVKPGDDLYFQPGGLHVMLINLKEELVTSDSIDIHFEFKRTGTQTVRLPVKAQY